MNKIKENSISCLTLSLQQWVIKTVCTHRKKKFSPTHYRNYRKLDYRITDNILMMIYKLQYGQRIFRKLAWSFHNPGVGFDLPKS